MVYAIDFIGMGASSRCKFDIVDAKESIEFIVEKIELWRKAMQIPKMHIMGHSLGGAMLGYYAIHYPHRVTKAYFVSSAGFSQGYFNRQDIEQKVNEFGFFKKILFKTAICAWDKRYTPVYLASKMGFLRKPLLKRFLKRWDGKMTQEAKELFSQYISALLKFSMSTDTLLLNLFDLGLKPYYPLDKGFTPNF